MDGKVDCFMKSSPLVVYVKMGIKITPLARTLWR